MSLSVKLAYLYLPHLLIGKHKSTEAFQKRAAGSPVPGVLMMAST